MQRRTMEHNTITEEQRARAERNRQAALAKKRKRGQPAPPAASGAAEAAEAPKMSREEYASICRMFGTQPSQASQASQPSQRDDGWPTSCVDVTEDEPPREWRSASRQSTCSVVTSALLAMAVPSEWQGKRERNAS